MSPVSVLSEGRAASRLVYSAKRSSKLRIGGLSILAGLLGLVPLSAMLRWHDGGPVPELRAFLALGLLLFIPFSVLAIVNAIRGLPRLTIDPQGVTLKHAHTSRWAHWDSLDPFVMKRAYAGRSKR